MKKKKAKGVSDVSIYEDDVWYVAYIGTDGLRKRMKLDAETRKDALHEVSHLLEIPESQIKE